VDEMNLQTLATHVESVREAYREGVYGTHYGGVHITKELFEKIVEENQLKIQVVERVGCDQYPIEAFFYNGDDKYFTIYSMNDFLYKGEQGNEQSTNAI
jgi:hypothetical protein